MENRKSSIPKFMKYSGSIRGPEDLSSRRGFSRVVEENTAGQIVEEKAEDKPSKKSSRGETRRSEQ